MTIEIDLTAIVPCKSLGGIDLEAIRAQLKQLAPDDHLEETLGGGALPDKAAKGVLVNYNGLSMAILGIDSALPVGTLVYGPSPNFFWPSAEKDLAGHTAHIRVMVIDQVATREDLLTAARALSLLTAAVCTVLPAMGVLWCAADHLIDPERFVKAANTATPGHTFAVIWVRMMAANTASGLIVGTRGLAPFAGRELEFAPTQTIDFGTLGMRVIQLTHYFIESGAEMKDGETIGPENFKIGLTDKGYFNGGPVCMLSKA